MLESLPNETYNELRRLCESGDQLAAEGRYADAIDTYWSAFELLPPPVEVWEAATWILTAIGDANFLGGDYEAAGDNLSVAMRCPDAVGNPFLHLRLGQCQLELGNLDRAADELARAYLGGGGEIFESEDGKYLTFLKTRLAPPVGGW
jgi:tetratricopeptide (TPR) repeat protein